MPYGARCNFEQDLCGWFNIDGKVLSWVRHNGSTPTNRTGPNVDHTYGNKTGKSNHGFLLGYILDMVYLEAYNFREIYVCEHGKRKRRIICEFGYVPKRRFQSSTKSTRKCIVQILQLLQRKSSARSLFQSNPFGCRFDSSYTNLEATKLESCSW